MSCGYTMDDTTRNLSVHNIVRYVVMNLPLDDIIQEEWLRSRDIGGDVGGANAAAALPAVDDLINEASGMILDGSFALMTRSYYTKIDPQGRRGSHMKPIDFILRKAWYIFTEEMDKLGRVEPPAIERTQTRRYPNPMLRSNGINTDQ
tara:strand:+ start:278 stop:721 length:444 start_codon:yes stop_codon:yes gene_type:complete